MSAPLNGTTIMQTTEIHSSREAGTSGAAEGGSPPSANPSHSPGPWTVVGDLELAFLFIGDEPMIDQDDVSPVLMRDGFDEAVGLANLHLMAAAPDLLLALRNAMPLLIAHQDSAANVARCTAALDAIAKAEGRP